MEYKLYFVEREEKLSSIAVKFDTTPQVLKSANPSMRTFGGLTGSVYVSVGQQIKIPISEPEIKETVVHIERDEEINNLIFEKARYRCEQTVVTKLNGLIQNHAETKREFLVERAISTKGHLLVKTKIVDNIIEVRPQPLTELMNLLGSIDQIKCNTLVRVNPQTGKISAILNHAQIIEEWKKYKKELLEKYSFIRSSKTKNDFDKFIQIAEQQIINEYKLIEDMNTKLFFDIFFDKYLVTHESLFEPFSRQFYSQLFDNVPVMLNFRQDILSESENEVMVRKVGDLVPDRVNITDLENIYNEKFKPIIKYKFSEFHFSFRERVRLNTADRWIETSDISIIEEVKNNIQILISYKLKKIE